VIVNRRIRAWFDAGKIAEAILGEGEFFVFDNSGVGRHNGVLVMGQLARWAADHGEEARAEDGVVEAIRTAIAREDLECAFRITWIALMYSDNDPDPPLRVDFGPVRAELRSLVRKLGPELEDNDSLWTLISSVQARIPGLS